MDVFWSAEVVDKGNVNSSADQNTRTLVNGSIADHGKRNFE